MNRLMLGLVLTLGLALVLAFAGVFPSFAYAERGEDLDREIQRLDAELLRLRQLEQSIDESRHAAMDAEAETPKRAPDPFPRSDYERDMRELFTQPSLRKHCDSPSRPSSLDKHCGGPY